MRRSLTAYAKDNIKEIHKMSAKCNGSGCDHTGKLIALAHEHACEIKELYERGDAHFIIETGDLLMLCLEMLAEHGKDPDNIMDICYRRYRDKLAGLIKSSGIEG
jgi:hypothetical protein